MSCAGIRKQAKETGVRSWFLLTDRFEDPARWRRLMKAVHTARAEGLPLTAQIAGRPIGVMMGIGTRSIVHGAADLQALETLPIAEQRSAARSRATAENPRRKTFRRRGGEALAVRQLVTSRWTSSSRWTIRRTRAGRKKERCAIAARTDVLPTKVRHDYIVEQNQYLFFPVVNSSRRPRADPRNAHDRPACSA